jgi:hypothetical protein
VITWVLTDVLPQASVDVQVLVNVYRLLIPLTRTCAYTTGLTPLQLSTAVNTAGAGTFEGHCTVTLAGAAVITGGVLSRPVYTTTPVVLLPLASLSVYVYVTVQPIQLLPTVVLDINTAVTAVQLSLYKAAILAVLGAAGTPAKHCPVPLPGNTPVNAGEVLSTTVTVNVQSLVLL